MSKDYSVSYKSLIQHKLDSVLKENKKESDPKEKNI